MKTRFLLHPAFVHPYTVLLSLALSLLASAAVAQSTTGRIDGIVTNSDESAFLEGATVTIEGTNRSTTTDRRLHVIVHFPRKLYRPLPTQTPECTLGDIELARRTADQAVS